MTATESRNEAFTVPGLDRDDTSPMLDALQRRLVALIDLGLTLKHIHWNVVGPSFIGVHEMLDPQYQAVSEMGDAIAERIATLGGAANGLAGNLVASRTWDDYSLGRDVVKNHLAHLDIAYSGVVGGHRAAISIVGEIDPVTEDLLIGQTGQLEQFQWFVRAHLETAAGNISTAAEAREAADGAR